MLVTVDVDKVVYDFMAKTHNCLNMQRRKDKGCEEKKCDGCPYATPNAVSSGLFNAVCDGMVDLGVTRTEFITLTEADA